MAAGERWARNGPSGFERRVAQAEPSIVNVAREIVARKGENNAPARTFCTIK